MYTNFSHINDNLYHGRTFAIEEYSDFSNLISPLVPKSFERKENATQTLKLKKWSEVLNEPGEDIEKENFLNSSNSPRISQYNSGGNPPSKNSMKNKIKNLMIKSSLNKKDVLITLNNSQNKKKTVFTKNKKQMFSNTLSVFKIDRKNE